MYKNVKILSQISEKNSSVSLNTYLIQIFSKLLKFHYMKLLFTTDVTKLSNFL